MRGIAVVDSNGQPDARLAGAIVVQALRDGILLLAGSPDGNVISLTPPFGIQPAEIDLTVARIQEYLTSLAGSIS